MSAVPQGHEKIDQRSIALHSAIAEKAARATRIAGDRAAERWIDSTIGEGSPFQRAFGYDAHGVGPETAVLPEGWRNRLVLVCGEDTLTGHRMVKARNCAAFGP